MSPVCVIFILEGPPRLCGMERGSFVCGYKCLSELDLFLKLLLLDSHGTCRVCAWKASFTPPCFPSRGNWCYPVTCAQCQGWSAHVYTHLLICVFLPSFFKNKRNLFLFVCEYACVCPQRPKGVRIPLEPELQGVVNGHTR